MLALHYVPGPPLAALVELFWLYEGFVEEHRRERLLPTGSMDLIISLRDDAVEMFDDEHAPARRFPGIVVSGSFSRYFVIDTLPTDCVMGVHFKPGGAFPFLGRLPADELHNEHVSLDDIWGGSAATELRMRILEAPTPAAKFAVLEHALIARASAFEGHRAVSFGVRTLARAPHVGTIASLVQTTGLSQTRFIDLFARETGYTPKKFARVQRFQGVLRRIESMQEADWADVATACGYFDQSHFIHDFRAFSGINPSLYFASRTRNRNHIVLP